MRRVLVTSMLLLAGCYRSHGLGDDAGVRIDAAPPDAPPPDALPPRDQCFPDEQVIDVPWDGACHAVDVVPVAMHGCGPPFLGSPPLPTIRIAHPERVRAASAVVDCTMWCGCDTWFVSLPTGCGSACESGHGSGGCGEMVVGDMEVARIDAANGPDRDPEYQLGAIPGGGTSTVTLCTTTPP